MNGLEIIGAIALAAVVVVAALFAAGLIEIEVRSDD